MLRRYAPEVAKAKEDDAEELEQAMRAEAMRTVTVKQAAQLSGYSETQIRAQVRSGAIPDLRPNGSGPMQLRVSDLAFKPKGRRGNGETVVDELAARRR